VHNGIHAKGCTVQAYLCGATQHCALFDPHGLVSKEVPGKQAAKKTKPH
jgi:hypothetical protein